ncbi:MAG TPA: N-acetylmuramoyl-L-alanine amidase [Caproicibacter sp.]|nr:N-acetylmuramoyl-L-alanine amidase [Caproicibacter sp.]
MNLHKLILTNNACYKAGQTILPKGIMVHSTGANNPNLRRYIGPDDGLLGKNPNNNHWNQDRPDGRDVCVHAFIGKLANGSVATYQTLPWNWRGWHCGGSGNDTHIGFEICEDGLTDAGYFSAVYQEAVDLCVYLCRLYSLTEKNVICHSEGFKLGIASNHSDVMHWFPRFGKSMDTFREEVKSGLISGTEKPVVSGDGSATFESYQVRVAISNLNIRTGPGTDYGAVGKCTGIGVFTIVEEAKGAGASKWGLLKSYKSKRNGWISLDYANKL